LRRLKITCETKFLGNWRNPSPVSLQFRHWHRAIR
jgi:hypothetical protein